MSYRSESLTRAMRDLLAEHVPDAQRALNRAEERLGKLEDRDARRRARAHAQDAALTDRYPTLGED
jgi:DnaJ-domain-containing protein 1